MTEAEWLACDDPDLLLEEVEGKVASQLLVDLVRQCWQRITASLPEGTGSVTVVEEFANLAPQMSAHDVALYAAEAILKAARWAPVFERERKRQAALLRQIIGRPA